MQTEIDPSILEFRERRKIIAKNYRIRNRELCRQKCRDYYHKNREHLNQKRKQMRIQKKPLPKTMTIRVTMDRFLSHYYQE